MKSERLPKYPELTLRIVKQGRPQGRYDDRYEVSDLLEEDQADIRAGKAVVVEVRLLSKANAKAIPKEIDTLFNRVGEPSVIGTYSHPEQIVDPQIRRDATDMWAVEFVHAGDIVRWRGREYRVEELEDVDREHAEVGYYTGYAFCRRSDDPPGGTCNPKRLRVDELLKVEDSAATQQTGQPVSKETEA